MKVSKNISVDLKGELTNKKMCYLFEVMLSLYNIDPWHSKSRSFVNYLVHIPPQKHGFHNCKSLNQLQVIKTP